MADLMGALAVTQQLANFINVESNFHCTMQKCFRWENRATVRPKVMIQACCAAHVMPH